MSKSQRNWRGLSICIDPNNSVSVPLESLGYDTCNQHYVRGNEVRRGLSNPTDIIIGIDDDGEYLVING